MRRPHCARDTVVTRHLLIEPAVQELEVALVAPVPLIGVGVELKVFTAFVHRIICDVLALHGDVLWWDEHSGMALQVRPRAGARQRTEAEREVWGAAGHRRRSQIARWHFRFRALGCVL